MSVIEITIKSLNRQVVRRDEIIQKLRGDYAALEKNQKLTDNKFIQSQQQTRYFQGALQNCTAAAVNMGRQLDVKLDALLRFTLENLLANRRGIPLAAEAHDELIIEAHEIRGPKIDEKPKPS